MPMQPSPALPCQGPGPPLSLIKRLPPHQIAEAERALTESRRRDEACVEIEGAAAERSCRACGADERRKCGRTGRGESRKGSLEWVRHRERPHLYPQPPRHRWRDYGRQGLPQAIVRRFLKPLLGVADRTGRTNFTYIPDRGSRRSRRRCCLRSRRMPCCCPTALRNTGRSPQAPEWATGCLSADAGATRRPRPAT